MKNLISATSLTLLLLAACSKQTEPAPVQPATANPCAAAEKETDPQKQAELKQQCFRSGTFVPSEKKTY